MASATARRIACPDRQVASSEAVALDDAQPLDGSNRRVRGALAPFAFPAGLQMAGSTLPAIVNLPDADGAVSPVRAAAQRRSRVSALTR